MPRRKSTGTTSNGSIPIMEMPRRVHPPVPERLIYDCHAVFRLARSVRRLSEGAAEVSRSMRADDTGAGIVTEESGRWQQNLVLAFPDGYLGSYGTRDFILSSTGSLLHCGSGRGRSSLAKAHTAPAGIASTVFADELDTGRVQSVDDLRQGVHDAPHIAFARLHALDGRQRHPRHGGQRSLIDSNQSAGGAQLCCSDHDGPLAQVSGTV